MPKEEGIVPKAEAVFQLENRACLIKNVAAYSEYSNIKRKFKKNVCYVSVSARPFSFLLLIFFLKSLGAIAQSGYDPDFVEVFPNQLGFRTYFSKKYTNILLSAPDESGRFVYRPNSGNNLGLGLTYRDFTVNIGVPFEFLNQNRRTDFPNYWDLQAHIYPRKMIIDLFGQFYSGYSLSADQFSQPSIRYDREDVKTQKLGLNVNYLVFGEKLSLQAAFNQTHIQKRSAFSPLIGFELYGGQLTGDSLLIPSQEPWMGERLEQLDFFRFGPNVGLAGSLVFGKGFFFTAVASIHSSVGFADAKGLRDLKRWSVLPSYFLRGFFGYSTGKFSINANYVWKNLPLGPGDYPLGVTLNTGNYRINFVYKFSMGEAFDKNYQRLNPLRIFRKAKDLP